MLAIFGIVASSNIEVVENGHATFSRWRAMKCFPAKEDGKQFGKVNLVSLCNREMSSNHHDTQNIDFGTFAHSQ